MGFNRNQVDELLVKCHRRCCICHRFCGTKIETDHIEPRAESQDNDIDNAIPVCFECHAEIHSYNSNHPRGRKFRPEELRQHRDQWLKICDQRPEAMLAAAWDRDVGPLQALVDELAYNEAALGPKPGDDLGAQFIDTQFQRAVQEGMIATLQDELKRAILRAYVVMSKANQLNFAAFNQDVRGQGDGKIAGLARNAVIGAAPLIRAASEQLMRFLLSEREP